MQFNKFFLCCAFIVIAGCMLPNTYYDPTDPYAYGVRWYDREDMTLRQSIGTLWSRRKIVMQNTG